MLCKFQTEIKYTNFHVSTFPYFQNELKREKFCKKTQIANETERKSFCKFLKFMKIYFYKFFYKLLLSQLFLIIIFLFKNEAILLKAILMFKLSITKRKVIFSNLHSYFTFSCSGLFMWKIFFVQLVETCVVRQALNSSFHFDFNNKHFIIDCGKNIEIERKHRKQKIQFNSVRFIFG